MGIDYQTWHSVWYDAINKLERLRSARNILDANAIASGEEKKMLKTKTDNEKRNFAIMNNERFLETAKSVVRDYFKLMEPKSKWVDENMPKIVETINRQRDIRSLIKYLVNTRLAYERLRISLTKEDRKKYPNYDKAMSEALSPLIEVYKRRGYREFIEDLIKMANKIGVKKFLKLNPNISEDDLLYIIGEYENG